MTMPTANTTVVGAAAINPVPTAAAMPAAIATARAPHLAVATVAATTATP
jgi:hypothetical protein